MRSWQLDILDKMSGFKPGELVVHGAGRGTGKSMLTKAYVDKMMRDLIDCPIEELVLSEGRVYGARYYCVEPVGGNWREIEDWCIKTYGPVSSVWRADKWVSEPIGRWYANNRMFWFRNEADRTMFVLKWS